MNVCLSRTRPISMLRQLHQARYLQVFTRLFAIMAESMPNVRDTHLMHKARSARRNSGVCALDVPLAMIFRHVEPHIALRRVMADFGRYRGYRM